ncbi:MAG: DUF423 domain-containing protein [Porticoccus sp.]|jgi:uncharacterized membrane protein YgdD (TMEM256/DUF423 family)
MKILTGMTAMLGFFAVALGAFGAHLLQGTTAPEMLNLWQTGVQYQMFHVLALLSVIVAANRHYTVLWSVVGWLFVMGSIIFSGSLYLLVITGIKAFGMITPIGGSMFLVGWLVLSFALTRTLVKS